MSALDNVIWAVWIFGEVQVIDEKLRERVLRTAAGGDRASFLEHATPSPVTLARKPVHIVESGRAARRLLEDLRLMPVSFVGLHVVYEVQHPTGSCIGWQDVDGQPVIAIALAPVVRRGGHLVSVRYLVDVRRHDVHQALQEVFTLSVPFVVHGYKQAYFGLSQLGVRWPRRWFCTWLASRLLNLGRHHARYEAGPGGGDDLDFMAQRTAIERREASVSLPTLASKYGVACPLPPGAEAGGSGTARGGRFTEPQAAVMAAPAHLVAGLYLSIRNDLVEQGLDHHHEQVEAPGALALAEIELRGVQVDRSKLEMAHRAATQAVATYEERMERLGFARKDGGAIALGHKELARVLKERGCLELFRDHDSRSGYSFDDKRLDQFRQADEVVDLLHRHRRYAKIANDKFFQGEYLDWQERVHPRIDPLGSCSGRPSMSQPNLIGIGRVMRPVVVPDEEGLCLVELDYISQDLLIAGAHFGCGQLLEDCTDRDPYCLWVRKFWKNRLSPGEDLLDDRELKARRGDLRDSMKVPALALLYGIEIGTLSVILGVSIKEAGQLRDLFFNRYPELRSWKSRAASQLCARGYVETVTGMRRFRKSTGRLSSWERRWAFNTPIQGGGACALKILLPRLADYLIPRGGRVVLPIHDAVLIQMPRRRMVKLAEGARQIMIDSIRSLYPSTRPGVSMIFDGTHCWCKDGIHDSVEQFLEDPFFTL